MGCLSFSLEPLVDENHDPIGAVLHPRYVDTFLGYEVGNVGVLSLPPGLKTIRMRRKRINPDFLILFGEFHVFFWCSPPTSGPWRPKSS